MAIKTVSSKKFSWHNISELDKDDLAWLKNEYKFHPLNISDCQGDNEHPKIDYYKDYFFLVVHFPEVDKFKEIIFTREVDIFAGNNYLITIQKQKNRALNKIFYRLTTNQSARRHYFSQGSGFLLYKVLDNMYKRYTPAARFIYNRLDQAEIEIFENETTASIRSLANIRRMILKTRLLLNPQSLLMISLQKTNLKFFSQELEPYFDDIRDYIDKMLSITDNQKDLIDGLFETNESMLSHRTNRVIKVLTVFSVSFLPLTLLTGIYGMNIGLPWANNPQLIWSIFGGLAVVVVGLLLFFKGKDLL